MRVPGAPKCPPLWPDPRLKRGAERNVSSFFSKRKAAQSAQQAGCASRVDLGQMF